MMRRAIPIFAALIALSQPATAGVPLFGHVSCTVVRFYVGKYSEAAAEKWARSHGASDAEIETARHCLHHSTDVQTASAAPSPQVAGPVSPQGGTQHKPDELKPDQDALRVSGEVQHAAVEPVSHDEEPGVEVVIRPKDFEQPPAVQASYQVRDELIPSDGKTNTSRSRNAGTARRAYGMEAGRPVAWLKRLWGHLTRRSPFAVAVLHPMR